MELSTAGANTANKAGCFSSPQLEAGGVNTEEGGQEEEEGEEEEDQPAVAAGLVGVGIPSMARSSAGGGRPRQHPGPGMPVTVEFLAE